MNLFDVIGWVLMGFVVGVLAKWIMPGKDPGGFWVTALIGIAGAFVGGFVSELIGLNLGFGMNLVFAVAGALSLLFVFRMVKCSEAA